jgi:hypothetical protein
MLNVRRAVSEGRLLPGGKAETGETLKEIIAGDLAVSLAYLKAAGAGGAFTIGANRTIENSRPVCTG